MKAKRFGGPRLTKKLQKAYEVFRNRVTEYLLSVGAKQSEDDPKDFDLDSPIGPVSFRIIDNWIAGRFEHEKAGRLWAMEHCSWTDPNPHSGKLNFHFADDAETLTSETLLVSFKHCVDMLCSFQPPQGFMAEAERLRKKAKQEYDERVARSRAERS